jgi:predicted NBD/HSP70 family sugar kinase
VRAENDVKAAALGAHALYGAQAGADGAMAYLNLGTGVAAGFVFGENCLGARGAAGGDRPPLRRPLGTSLHVRAAGLHRGVLRRRRDRRAVGADVPLPVLDVFDHADAGDPLALELRAGLVYGVASAIRVIMLSGDAEKIVLGEV